MTFGHSVGDYGSHQLYEGWRKKHSSDRMKVELTRPCQRNSQYICPSQFHPAEEHLIKQFQFTVMKSEHYL